MTKKCNRCQQDLPLEMFSQSGRSPDGLQYSCKPCANEMGRENYQANKARYFANAKRRDQEMYAKLNGLQSVPCADCNQSFDPICMDFDHLPQFTKLYDISKMRRRRMAWSRIEAEVAKCEVVCANCHRLRSKKRWIAKGKDVNNIEVGDF